ncbi:sarcosine oxidase subunit gamma [Planomonospora parontospora subsp. parontospora]|uniref:Sarcosine oxidase subunit gamma n=2 Tax=Planomonospora parontospora TaxID=58119 RepID=A0AA37BAY1_9ACTN|nr:sarcosine oxidase subunit gamma family protein [Planomonospora parontospora]GGK45219.1 sarcosine oxidase subunit gamma [Planomonospora parontospora]GII06295.1 sarcosine oxidase subunit gamma [Planomonospora parontospora subsp. parontospora]
MAEGAPETGPETGPGTVAGAGRAVRRSPLGGFAPVAGERVRMAETPFLAQVDVRADPLGEAAAGLAAALGTPLPVRPGTYTGPVTGYPPCSVFWLGPDKWLVVGAEGGTPQEGGPPGGGAAAGGSGPPGGSGTLGGGAAAGGSGPSGGSGAPGESGLAARLRAAAGDGHAAVTDVSAQRTVIRLAGPAARDVLAHGCPLDLHPRVFGPGTCARSTLARADVLLAAGEDEEFQIFVRSSFAAYLWAWLLDAATEYLR